MSTSISQLDEGRVTVQDFPPGLRTILTDFVEEFIELVSKLTTRLDGEGVIVRFEGAVGAGGWKYSYKFDDKYMLIFMNAEDLFEIQYSIFLNS